MTYSTVTITMKEFRDNIGEDEEMLQFAANHLDTPDDAKVHISIKDQQVTFELIGEYKCTCGRDFQTLVELVDHATTKMMPLRRIEMKYGKESVEAALKQLGYE